MMQKSFTTLIQESKEDIRGLIESKKQLWLLTAMEKGVPVGLRIGYQVVLAVLAIFMLSFALTAGAFGFSLLFAQEAFFVLRSITFGFLCLSGVLLLVLLLLLALQGVILRSINNGIMDKYLDKMNEQEQKQAQRNSLQNSSIAEVESTENINPIAYYEK